MQQHAKRSHRNLAFILGTACLLAGHAGQSRAACQEATVPEREPCYDLTLGEAVFTRTCLSCHATGVAGAPRLGAVTDWETRIRQDPETLIRHAIDGHGQMPPKGGFYMLTDQEVAAAVAYVLDRSRKIILARDKKTDNTECDPIRFPEKCSEEELQDVMTLHMLWLFGNPGE